MKRSFLTALVLCMLIGNLIAQNLAPPQALNYQAIARDSTGAVRSNQSVALRFSILDSSSSVNSLYTESFHSITNQFGLFSVDLGTGSVISGAFSNINWSMGKKWLKVEMDMNNGSNFIVMGISQFLSVPYALYAEKSGTSYYQNINTSFSVLGDTLFMGNTFVIVPGVSMANACRMDFTDSIPYTSSYPHAGDNPYNTALYGLPKFILKNYIELDKIDSISRFRSGIGHDYSDYYETCRSMKHYFKPRANVDWSLVKIFSPVNGIVSSSTPESIGGNQVWITPTGMPAFSIILFHVNLSAPLVPGQLVFSGQELGLHTGPQTTSDIAIQVNEPNVAWRRVSYFDLMNDKLFACYISRGVMTRDALIISKTDRDADGLLPCNGNQFFYHGTIENWVTLH